MIDPITLHAELIAYCQRNGVQASSFGSLVVGQTAFASSLRSGTASINKVLLARRFMRENPEVPRRTFAAMAKGWRERIAAEVGCDGSGGAHATGHAAAVDAGVITDATLDQVAHLHNQESHDEVA